MFPTSRSRLAWKHNNDDFNCIDCIRNFARLSLDKRFNVRIGKRQREKGRERKREREREGREEREGERKSSMRIDFIGIDRK